jgi:hypothetical protein
VRGGRARRTRCSSAADRRADRRRRSPDHPGP